MTALNTEVFASAPHAHDRSSVNYIMRQVCVALMPLTALGFYLFGWPAMILWAVTCLSALMTEALCLWLMQKPLSRLLDSSALLTGWLLALSIPPWAPWWIGVGGSAFAIAAGKQLYGGIGQNIFNPAMLARTALLVSFPVQMTTWVSPQPFGLPNLQDSLGIVFFSAPWPDGLTGASLLGELKSAYSAQLPVNALLANEFSIFSASFGFTSGSLGETSEVLALLGGGWLLWRRIITWHIPVSMILSVLFLATVFHHSDSARYASPLVHLTSGALVFMAFFIATDYVTSPSSPLGKVIFGFGCGFLTFLIRSWGGFPEGAGFAVLIMNTLTPMIDRYVRPRIYGRTLSRNAINAKAIPRKVN